MKKEIYTSYSKETSVTMIFEDVFDDNGNLVSTEVKGFYFGYPNEEDNKEFYGKLKAIYEM